MKNKFRTMTVGVFWCETVKSWSNAALVFKDQRSVDGNWKKVVIEIDGPSDISYIRDQLDEIEKDWKKRLGLTV